MSWWAWIERERSDAAPGHKSAPARGVGLMNDYWKAMNKRKLFTVCASDITIGERLQRRQDRASGSENFIMRQLFRAQRSNMISYAQMSEMGWPHTHIIKFCGGGPIQPPGDGAAQKPPSTWKNVNLSRHERPQKLHSILIETIKTAEISKTNTCSFCRFNFTGWPVKRGRITGTRIWLTGRAWYVRLGLIQQNRSIISEPAYVHFNKIRPKYSLMVMAMTLANAMGTARNY